jgi:hypothetical protein
MVGVTDRSAEKMHLLSDWNRLRELGFFEAVILYICMNAETAKVPLPSRGYLWLPREGRLKAIV